MNVANPARGGNAAGAMQSYELPPYRQDHRYEATLEAWSPLSLAFRILDGAFAVPVGADTRFVVLQIRPVIDRGCTAIDFRWDFQA